jgi:hypothetical protein
MGNENIRGLTKGHLLLHAAIEKAGGQAAFARKVGVSRATVHFWTRGAMPTIALGAALSRYGIPVSSWSEVAAASETKETEVTA